MSDSAARPQVGGHGKGYFTHAVAVGLAATLILVWTMTAIAQTLRIGALVPTAGPDKLLGNQVEISTKLGVQAVKSQWGNVKIIPTTAWDGKNISSGLQQLRRKDVNVVIGGVTLAAAKEFHKLAAKRNIPPTILLTSNPDERVVGRNRMFLHMGISPEVYYQDNLLFWTETLKLKKIGVIYDQGYKNTLLYGKDLTLGALKDKQVGIHMVPFTAKHTPGYDDQVTKIVNYNPDAIILAGRSWDVENLIYDMSNHFKKVPIFLPQPPAEQQIKNFASVTPGGIYYGAQWLLHNNQKIRPFMSKVNKHLGWHDQVVSPLAIKTYNAVQVLATAWDVWVKGDKMPPPEPWAAIMGATVEGLAGPMRVTKFKGSYTVLAPLNLYKATSAGLMKWGVDAK